MKTKYLLLAGILGILSAATAGAQTVIYISGAPAARTPFSSALYRVLTAGVSGTGGTITYAYSGTSKTTLTTANALAFYGGHVVTTSGTIPVTVEVSYVGSSAGIQAVADQQSVQFLSGTDTAASSPYAEPNGNTNAAQYQSAVPNFTVSDEFQGSTPWLGTNTLNTNFNSAQVYKSLHSDVVGILPYEFVTNVDAPSSITNITPNQAQTLFEQGLLPLAQLTGNSADGNGYIYAVGRDIGSGLRTVFLSESGIGVQTPITQYAPVTGTSVGSYTSGAFTSGDNAIVTGTYTYVTSQPIYPNETINGVPLDNGDGGYSSFTPLQTVLASYSNSNGASITTDGTAGWYVTPLAYPDAKTAQKAGSHEVQWDGIWLTGTENGALASGGAASANLANGSYTFWSYLQVNYLAGTSWNSNKTVADFEADLGNDLITTDATVLLNNVNVSRSLDGGQISYTNPYASPYSITRP
jgi:hypothetical protein